MSLVYFTDRDLGKQFPAILVEAGLAVERHGAHFAPDTPDEVWIAAVAARGWVAVSHDRRIGRRPNERAAVLAAGPRLLIVIGNVPNAALARNFVATASRIAAFVERRPGPWIARVYQPAPADVKKREPRGRVEHWLP